MFACYCSAKKFVFFFSHSHQFPSSFLFLNSNKLVNHLLQESDFEHCLISCRWLRVYCLMKYRPAQFSYEVYSYFEFAKKVSEMHCRFQSFSLVTQRSFCRRICFLLSNLFSIYSFIYNFENLFIYI